MPGKKKEEFFKRIKDAMNSAWNAIAFDLLEGRQQDVAAGLEDGDPFVMTRDEVIEVVLDSSFLEAYGGDEEAVAKLRALSYENQQDIAKRCFPDKEYGW